MEKKLKCKWGGSKNYEVSVGCLAVGHFVVVR